MTTLKCLLGYENYHESDETLHTIITQLPPFSLQYPVRSTQIELKETTP